MVRQVRGAWLLAVAIAAAGCEREESGAPPTRVAAPGALIDAGGGTVEHDVAGWKVRITLPEGAVSAPIALGVAEQPAETGVLFAADFTPSPYQFLKPIEVSFNECGVPGFPYVLPVAARAATKIDGVWEPLPTERRGPCEIVAEVHHFSVIGLLPEGEHHELLEETGELFTVGPITFASSEVVSLLRLRVLSAAVDVLFESEAKGDALMTVTGLRPKARAYITTDGVGAVSVEHIVDADGVLVFAQPTGGKRAIRIEAVPGTKFIDATDPLGFGGDCGGLFGIGEWWAESRTCELTGDLFDRIVIISSDTTLDCDGRYVSFAGSAMQVLSITAEPVANVVVHNCTFETTVTNPTVVFFPSARAATLENSHARALVPYGSGIEVMGAAGSIVRRNTVTTQGIGITVSSAAQATVSENRVRSGTVSSGTIGVQLVGSQTTASVVTGNNVVMTGGGSGVALLSTSGNVVADNRVTGAGDGLQQGSTTASISNEFARNHVSGCQNALVVHWGEVVAHHNVFANNARGVFLGFEALPSSRFWLNDFVGNTRPIAAVPSFAGIELSDGGVGNYWGRDCAAGPPFFVAGVDSNAANIVDGSPFGVSVASIAAPLVPAPPGCSIAYDVDLDGFAAAGYGGDDCDDTNAAIHPGAAELCDAADNDCDARVDEDFDADGDSYTPCAAPLDCNDADPSSYPGSAEFCDGTDNDCDTLVDEDFDEDGDGYTTCAEPFDCDEADPARSPGSIDVCDGVDNNCDGTIDEGYDEDGDGYSPCGALPDCNDADAAIHPGVSETCDGVDNDCDSVIDDGFDQDADGYTQCAVVPDCDDANAAAHPGAAEPCDSVDNDCDGVIDNGFDQDADGFTQCAAVPDCNDANATINPGAAEPCDSVDNDCDGVIDDGFDQDADGFTGCAATPDCDDTNAAVRPGATELCNGRDDNCVAGTDEGYGLGDACAHDTCSAGVIACASETSTYCRATGASAVIAIERCDLVDSDCDGSLVDQFTNSDGDWAPDCADPDDDNDGVPDTADPCPFSPGTLACAADDDGDGFTDAQEGLADRDDPNTYRGAIELCDGKDNDLDGRVDEDTGCSICP